MDTVKMIIAVYSIDDTWTQYCFPQGHMCALHCVAEGPRPDSYSFMSDAELSHARAQLAAASPADSLAFALLSRDHLGQQICWCHQNSTRAGKALCSSGRHSYSQFYIRLEI